MVRPEIGSGKGGDYSDDLEERGAVVPGDTRGGVYVLEELEKDAWS